MKKWIALLCAVAFLSIAASVYAAGGGSPCDCGGTEIPSVGPDGQTLVDCL